MIARRSSVVRVGMAVFAVIALVYFAHFAHPAFVAAEHYRVDCREASDQPPGFGKLYNCTFRNTTGAAVNDIEVTFTDRAIRVGPTSPIWACTRGNSLPPQREPTSMIFCRAARAGDAVAAGENFILTVRADIVPPIEWSWSLDGTSIPTTTHTPTPTPTPVVRLRASRTPSPTPSNTPPPPTNPPQDTRQPTSTDKPPEQPTQPSPPTATR